jgi:hypothetical protein
MGAEEGVAAHVALVPRRQRLKAGANAFKMRSTTVGSVRLQLPTGAGEVALKIFPVGMTTLSARKHPSSMGEKGLTSDLKATRAAATAPDSPELIDPGT